MHYLEELLFELKQALKEGASAVQLERWKNSPLLKEHELVEATYAVLAQWMGYPVPQIQLKRTSGGAVTLFEKGFFPWRGLPYPREHAELGLRLFQRGQKESALSMAPFQKATLDHNLQPIYALFKQDGAPFRHALVEANAAFFEAIGQKPDRSGTYVDPELAFLAKKSESATVVCVGSGCKSGLGAFLHHDAGIVNWGPQTTAVGNCTGFGLAGRAQRVEIEESDTFRLSFLCRLATPLPRETGFSALQDSGFSGLWIDAALEGNLDQLSCSMTFQSSRPSETPLLTLFGKGNGCWLGASHKLNPGSLDRYQGPPQPLLLTGASGAVRIEVQGALKLEIIPLAGDESFWGANFLMAYTLQEAPIRFTLQKNG